MAKITHFGLNNFRVFQNLTEFELKPLTILTGTNNSGKSSVNKALTLLEESLRNDFPLLNFSNSKSGHNLGCFQFVLPRNRKVDNDSIIVSYSFETPFSLWMNDCAPFAAFQHIKLTYKKNGDDGLLKKIEIDSSGPLGKPMFMVYSLISKQLDITFEEAMEGFGLNEEQKVRQPLFDINFLNKKELSTQHQKAFINIPLFIRCFLGWKHLFPREVNSNVKFGSEELANLFKEFETDTDLLNFKSLENINDFDFKRDFIDSLKNQILHAFFNKIVYRKLPFNDGRIIGQEKDVFQIRHEAQYDFEYLINLLFRQINRTLEDENFTILNLFDKEDLVELSPDFELFLNAFGEKKVKEIIHEDFEDFFELALKPSLIQFLTIIPKQLNVTKLSAVRSVPSMLYTNGIPNELYNLLRKLRNRNFIPDRLNFFKKWVKEFEIGDEIKFSAIAGLGFTLKILKDNEEFNLTDSGLGFAQLIPIVLAVSMESEINKNTHDHTDLPLNDDKKIFIIEEPEVNLHPALQSKLADFFIDAMKYFNVQFIIETHSEYLIRKLQFLTAKEKIKPKDSVIYYFYPPNKVPKGEPQVKRIDIEKDGRLTDEFGSGFLDEADNLAIDLFQLSKSQKN